MREAETTFRDQNDYVSKYRRVVEYFGAVKVGLAATPTLHTAQIFGDPIYRYSYREAVIDGWLIDHDPPHLIKTALSEAGITIEAGETIDVLDPRTGEIDTATLPDQLDFTVEHFNRRVRVPKFNQVVAAEIARRVDIMSPNAGKLLAFATSVDHADEVVQYLRQAYRYEGLEIIDDMIQKIIGSVDKPGKVILKYKNEADPRIAVTVDAERPDALGLTLFASILASEAAQIEKMAPAVQTPLAKMSAGIARDCRVATEGNAAACTHLEHSVARHAAHYADLDARLRQAA